MNMPGMSMGTGGGHMGAAGPSTPDLLPTWLAVVATLAFLAVAASHVRHMSHTGGQRRPWHACHVLIAAGMAFMYLSASVPSLALPTGFWRAVFACAGLVAALWAVGGNARVPVLMWTLAALDLGAMVYMWSRPAAAISWLLVAYLVGSAAMWALDAYRRLDRDAPLIAWQALGAGGEALGAGGEVTAGASGAESLLGQLDIGLSMIVMALGMAYMVLAMQLMS